MPVYKGKQALNALFQRAAYATSAHDLVQLPSETGVEVAFAGRSNSGKSSVINALTSQRRLAHVSRTPGRTQSINFFAVEEGSFLVDLPGYGYAAISQEHKRRWERLISTYIMTRNALSGLILVMDARQPFGPLDAQLLGWLRPRRIPCHALLTKTDKLSAQGASAALRYAERRAPALTEGACSVQLFSSKTREGVDTARQIIGEWLQANKKPPVKGE